MEADMINGNADFREYGSVPIPHDKELADEPARWVAKTKMWRTAIVGLLAAMGIVIAPELVADIDTFIQAAIVVLFGVVELYNRYRQGEETRARVYAPSTVAQIEVEAQREVI